MNITVDKSSPAPYYYQIKEAVKSLITRGRLKPGDMLPSEFALSEKIGVSRLVVHRAFRELVTEGLLVRQRARGTFVAPRAKRSYTVVGPLLSMTELTKDGLRPHNRILTHEVIPVGPEAGAELHLPPGSPVVHLSNLRFIDKLPLAIEDMYFPEERVPGMADLSLDNQSIYSVLEKTYAAHPQEALDVVAAGAATREEARLLGINKGAPVMRVQRTSTDSQGRPIEFSKVVFHAGRYQFVALVKRTG